MASAAVGWTGGGLAVEAAAFVVAVVDLSPLILLLVLWVGEWGVAGCKASRGSSSVVFVGLRDEMTVNVAICSANKIIKGLLRTFGRK